MKESIFSASQDIEEKAGYNQAGEISRILSMLRYTFISSMINNPNDFNEALECCRGVMNVISGKVKPEIITKINTQILKVEKELPKANETYINKGIKFFKNSKERLELKREIENLWREIEKTQDVYGYGMFSEDDSGL